jgi:hypothetical protein
MIDGYWPPDFRLRKNSVGACAKRISPLLTPNHRFQPRAILEGYLSPTIVVLLCVVSVKSPWTFME